MIWKDNNNNNHSSQKSNWCAVLLTTLENTLATFSAIFTKGNNFCDFLFALKQLAGQVVDAGEFESPIGRVHLMIVQYFIAQSLSLSPFHHQDMT